MQTWVTHNWIWINITHLPLQPPEGLKLNLCLPKAWKRDNFITNIGRCGLGPNGNLLLLSIFSCHSFVQSPQGKSQNQGIYFLFGCLGFFFNIYLGIALALVTEALMDLSLSSPLFVPVAKNQESGQQCWSLWCRRFYRKLICLDCHRMVWIEKDIKHHLLSTLLLWARTTLTWANCSKPHSTWTFPGVDGASTASPGNLCLIILRGNSFFQRSNPNLPSFS